MWKYIVSASPVEQVFIINDELKSGLISWKAFFSDVEASVKLVSWKKKNVLIS